MEEEKSFWEEFIEIYQEQTCLWDISSEDYTNKHKRNVGYAVLLNKLKEINRRATIDTLKKKIGNMRTSFRRELNKVEQSKREGTEIYQPTLWYFDLLLFTVQGDCPRRKSKLTDNTCGDEHLEIGSVENDDGYEEQPEDLLQLSHSPMNGSTTPIVVIEDVTTPDTSRSSFCAITEPITRKRLKPQRSPIEPKKSHMVNSAHIPVTSDDECTVAGKRISYQLKGMDERQRIIAEKLISDIIYYGRIGKLTEDCSDVLYNVLKTSSSRVSSKRSTFG